MTGISELDVPGMEPLSIGTITINRGVQSNITDLLVRGASTFIIEDLKYVIFIVQYLKNLIVLNCRADLESNRFDVKVRIPALTFAGKYELDLMVLFIPVRGNGNIVGNISKYLGI